MYDSDTGRHDAQPHLGQGGARCPVRVHGFEQRDGVVLLQPLILRAPRPIDRGWTSLCATVVRRFERPALHSLLARDATRIVKYPMSIPTHGHVVGVAVEVVVNRNVDARIGAAGMRHIANGR